MGANNSSFTMELERPDGVYYAGETVKGKITIVNSKDIKCRGIHVIFKGVGEMCYYESRGGDKGGSDCYFSSKLYTDQRTTVFGTYYDPNGPIIESVTFPAGTHEFPFAFPLAVDAPGSAEMNVMASATIRYSLSAYVDRGTKKQSSEQRSNDFSTGRFVAVLPKTPLPPLILLRAIEHKCQQPMKLASCWLFPCFVQGDVALDAKLMRQTFAPGEVMDFLLRIINNMNKAIYIKVELVCCVLQQRKAILFGGNGTPQVISKRTEVRECMFQDTVQPHSVYVIGHDPTDRNLSTSQELVTNNYTHEADSLNSVRKIPVPVVPPTFHGAPGMGTSEECDPVIFAYSIVFTVGALGCYGAAHSVSFSVIISAVPPSAAELQAARLASNSNTNSTCALSVVQQVAPDGGDPFLLQYNTHYVPEEQANNEVSPVAKVVALKPTKLHHDAAFGPKYQPYGLSYATGDVHTVNAGTYDVRVSPASY